MESIEIDEYDLDKMKDDIAEALNLARRAMEINDEILRHIFSYRTEFQQQLNENLLKSTNAAYRIVIEHTKEDHAGIHVDKISKAMDELRFGPDKNMNLSEFVALMREKLMGIADAKPTENKTSN